MQSSGLSSEYKEEIKKKEPASSSNSAVRDTNTQKTFTRYLPTLQYKCILTLAVTTDVYKHYTAASPQPSAAAIRHSLLANPGINFI
jgi:hypothetical protein